MAGTQPFSQPPVAFSPSSARPRLRLLAVLGLLLAVLVPLLGHPPGSEAAGKVTYTGVNLASAEFGIDPFGTAPSGSFPGSNPTNWIYPTRQEVDYFTSKGMNFFRIPFAWERMQPQEYGALDATSINGLRDLVNYITQTKGATALIDMHNYAFRYQQPLGRVVSNDSFRDVWRRLANEFKGNSKVFFGLMNEPHDTNSDRQGTRIWRESAQAAIDGIRSTGATNKIFVAGNGWSHGDNWIQNTLNNDPQAWYGEWNGVEMLKLTDSANNLVFEQHTYSDQPDRNGMQDGACYTSPSFATMLDPMTNWLRQNGRKGFMGEFSFPADQSSCTGFWNDALSYMQNNNDVWLGWAYWAAGPRWGSACGKLCIEPVFNGDGSATDKPQMAILAPYLAGTPSGGSDVTVYGDALASGWNDWSWSSTRNFASTERVQSGTASLKVTYNSGGGGLSLRATNGLSGYSAVSFYVYGSGSNVALNFYVQTTDTGGETSKKAFTAQANQWTFVRIPLSDIGNPATIKRLNFMSASGATVYFDTINIVR
ncbi:MAG: glycoside hydrolase family 5 protein [Chloroflexaceae bacterium]|jgi:endoglucanase|nr:glycoside hydrolase family 5 protein [Chloroflexaceae bacterium]